MANHGSRMLIKLRFTRKKTAISRFRTERYRYLWLSKIPYTPFIQDLSWFVHCPRLKMGTELGQLQAKYMLTLSLLKWPKQKIHQKFQISFRKILRNKLSHAKVLPKRFHLNGNVIRFCQQIFKKIRVTNHLTVTWSRSERVNVKSSISVIRISSSLIGSLHTGYQRITLLKVMLHGTIRNEDF